MLPTDPKERKAIPIWSGCIAYFPNALVAIAGLSQRANDQHNPGEPLHWAMEKSTDEQDAGMRHAIEPLLIGAGEYDNDGTAHKVKKAWRAIAELERWLLAGNEPYKTVLGLVLERMRECTCHPTDRPPGPCPQKFAAKECQEADGDTHMAPMHDETGIPWGSASPLKVKGVIVFRNCGGATIAGRPCGKQAGHTGFCVPEPVICTDCGADLEETGHFASCLSQAAHVRRLW